jgi:hypothetical protein
VRDRNAPQKQVWRAEIVLLSADGVGTNEIKRRTGKSKTCVWPHKHSKVRKWLDRHRRFTFHFTSTSSSWLNAVEGFFGFFAKLSRRRVKRGVFRSVRELKAAINRFLDETNNDPKPFTWTADPNKIVAAVKRGHQLSDSVH